MRENRREAAGKRTPVRGPGRSHAAKNSGRRTGSPRGGSGGPASHGSGKRGKGPGRDQGLVSSLDLSGYDEDMQRAIKAELHHRKLRRRIVMTVCAVLMVVGLGYFGYYYYNADRTSGLYESAAVLKRAKPVPTVTINRTQEGEAPDILEEYSLLYSTHKNLIGWLKIEDTVVDYPVMQLDNDFYLNHNFKGDSDRNGAIFLDRSCDVQKPSTNLILYGHHMKSGNMFGDLDKYADKSYGQKHSRIFFDSLYEKGEYELMYVFRETIKDSADVSFKYYQFFDAASPEEFDSNMKAMASKSLYDTGVTASFGDRLLTLSTCDSRTSDGRFVVVAKRIKED